MDCLGNLHKLLNVHDFSPEMVTRIGFEPISYTGGGVRPKPLDERAVTQHNATHALTMGSDVWC